MIIGIIGIIVGLIIAIVPFLWKKYISRPEVTIEIIKNGGSSIPIGLSNKNEINEGGYIVGETAIQVFELSWRFKIRITNNSDLTAFYPELTFNTNGPKLRLIDKLNKLQPIKPTETIELKSEYKKYEEKMGRERTKVGVEMPNEFNALGILLTYKNSYKRLFHTLYDFSENKNNFLRKRPIEYQQGF